MFKRLVVLSLTGCSIFKNDNNKGAEVMTNGVQNTMKSTNESLMMSIIKITVMTKINFLYLILKECRHQ